MRAASLRWLAGSAGVVLLASASSAVPITPAAFGASPVVENFEGVTAGANVGTSAYANIVLPGTVSAFTFGSGVVLTSPVPNPGLFSNGPFLHDAALAGAVNNWGANGNVANAGDVPDPWGLASSAYLGAFDNLGAGSVSIELSFSSDMARVGAWVAGAAGSTVRIDAYDGSGNLLESSAISAPSVASWGTNAAFLGLERSEGIRRVVFTGTDFGLDGLTFEPLAVPGPATAILLALGLGGAAWRRGLRSRVGA